MNRDRLSITVSEAAGFGPVRTASKQRQQRQKRRQQHRRQVLARDGHVCTYCGDVATTTDHIIPLHKGGEDTVDNQTAACLRCNRLLAWMGL